MPNWGLHKCCNREQVIFLAFLGVCSVIILALWKTVLLRPFKLVTVFLHEASHAIVCKLTCGHVEGIQVHADEGGATQTRGGVYWLILPAGYLGSSFWGMVLIIASTHLLTARIAAGCFAAAFLIVLFVAKNESEFCMIYYHSSIKTVDIAMALHWIYSHPCCHLGAARNNKIPYPSLCYPFHGCNEQLVFYIYDQAISRRVHSSDAEKFAEICPCPCSGFGWGIIWGLISFLFLAGAMYLGLVLLS